MDFSYGGVRGDESLSEGGALRLSAFAIYSHHRNTMAGVTWHYVLKFIITGEPAQSVQLYCSKELTDAFVL